MNECRRRILGFSIRCYQICIDISNNLNIVVKNVMLKFELTRSWLGQMRRDKADEEAFVLRTECVWENAMCKMSLI